MDKQMKWGDQWHDQAMSYLLKLGPNSHFENLIKKLSTGMCLILGASGEVFWVYKSSKNIKEIVGINISRKELQKIDKKIACLIVCDAHNLPFKDSCFNVIVCKSTLHHLNDVSKGILEMQRVLCKGGIVPFYEPGALNPIAMFGRKFFPTSIHVASERPFIPIALKEMLSKSHFIIFDEGYYFLFVHLLPVFGRWISLFRNGKFLNLFYYLGALLCTSSLKQFCWILVYGLRKG